MKCRGGLKKKNFYGLHRKITKIGLPGDQFQCYQIPEISKIQIYKSGFLSRLKATSALSLLIIFVDSEIQSEQVAGKDLSRQSQIISIRLNFIKKILIALDTFC